MRQEFKVTIKITAGELLQITCNDSVYFNDIFFILRAKCEIPVMWESGENNLYITKSYKKSDGLPSTGTYKEYGEVVIACASSESAGELVEALLLKDIVVSVDNAIYFNASIMAGGVGSSWTGKTSSYGCSIPTRVITHYARDWPITGIKVDQEDVERLGSFEVEGEYVSKVKNTIISPLLPGAGPMSLNFSYSTKSFVGDSGEPLVNLHRMIAVNFIRQGYNKCVENKKNLPFIAEVIKLLLKHEVSLSPSILASHEQYLATLPEAGATSSTLPEAGATSSTLPEAGATSSTLPEAGATSSTLPEAGATSSTLPEDDDTSSIAGPAMGTAPSGAFLTSSEVATELSGTSSVFECLWG